MPKLLKELKVFYGKNKRDFPWRHTHDPYRILVSEMMLQQTQASRVVPFYTKFVKEFPTANALAKTPLSRVLVLWQGLGYNRRARFLHEAAKIIAHEGFGGRLPGVGPYTAAAIDAFAHNRPTVFIETNIRTVFTHHFFPKTKKVDDKKLLPLIQQALKKSKMQPKDFYSALMDYGSYLKTSGIKINSRSKHYIKQSKFEGSARQKRAAKLRKLLERGASEAELLKALK